MTNEKHTNEEAIKILEEAIEVINRQKAEIGILRDYNKDMFAEIRNLNGSLVSNTMENQKIRREAKIEAYKEFAERLKQHKRKMSGFDLNEEFWDYAVLVENIDELLKEMIAE